MKEFHIKHDNEAIHLETEFTKFDSLERIMLLSASEFVNKGKTVRLKEVLGVIEEMLCNNEK